jgi:anti-sigma28 factor (negative regulator of flagellin synthesis)
MNVNEPNRSASSSSAATARARQSAQTEPARFPGSPEESPVSTSDGHLAELVRSLCALAADSPERQAKIQGLMRAYATGTLHVDAEATAGAMIDDAFRSRLMLR